MYYSDIHSCPSLTGLLDTLNALHSIVTPEKVALVGQFVPFPFPPLDGVSSLALGLAASRNGGQP